MHDTTVKSERKDGDKPREDIKRIKKRKRIHAINYPDTWRTRLRTWGCEEGRSDEYRFVLKRTCCRSGNARIIKRREKERRKNILIKKKKKRGRERVTMVVIYDRFVFFSVEKFFIPLLYSCLNILVQRSCANAYL